MKNIVKSIFTVIGMLILFSVYAAVFVVAMVAVPSLIVECFLNPTLLNFLLLTLAIIAVVVIIMNKRAKGLLREFWNQVRNNY